MDNPIVSILIICYNHQHYVQQSINSVLQQTYKNIELIVIDDNSSDNSASVIEEININSNFLFIKNEINIGLNNSIVKGIGLSNGEYISVLASDDLITPEKIEEQIKYLTETGLDGVYANGYTLQGDRKDLITLNKVFDNYSQKTALIYLYKSDWNAPLLQSALFKKIVWVSLIDLRKDFKSDDWAFLIKCLEVFKIGFINKPYFIYRLHDTNSHKSYWKTFPMRMDIASRLVPPQYRTKTISNILLSQSQYLIADKKVLTALKFFICSLLLSFHFNKVFRFGRSVGSLIKQAFLKKRITFL